MSAVIGCNKPCGSIDCAYGCTFGNPWTGSAADSEQPLPVDNANPPIWPIVIEDMARRDIMGRTRYGVALKANNGRDTMRDAYEEALDLAVYLRTLMFERDGK